MTQVAFGAGRMFGLRTDVSGVITPAPLGLLQDIQFEFSFDVKELYGSKQFASVITRGKGKITGKAKSAKISGQVWNDLYFGQTLTTGQTQVALSEVGTVPATSSYSVTAANGATFLDNLGVVYAATGAPLTRVAATPAAGQYMVDNAGVYTFAAADASAKVLLNYEYTTTGAGSTIVMANQDMGASPTWKGVFTTKFRNKQVTLGLNACVSGKLSLPTKQDDWVIPELDVNAGADDADNIGYISLSE